MAVLFIVGFVGLVGALLAAVYVATYNRQAELEARFLRKENQRLKQLAGGVYDYAWHNRDAVPELQVVSDTVEHWLGTADEIILHVQRSNQIER